jgi:hypothetical protein
VARFDLRAWALIGAQKRLEEIREERRSIQTAFPDLRGGGSEVGSGRKGGLASVRGGSEGQILLSAGGGAQKPKRKRFTMSAEARRAISLAQKRRWRKVRAAKKSSS